MSIGVSERIANAPHAITELVARWRCDALVVFEATGVYDLELRAALRAADIRFARINPARARDFARASGQLAKTDPIDARMLAAFARAIRPATEQVSTPARNALARLAKRRDQLVLMRAQEKNRRSEAADRTDTASAALPPHVIQITVPRTRTCDSQSQRSNVIWIDEAPPWSEISPS